MTIEFENILVTGGAGFIGSNFIRFVLERAPEVSVINLDALTYAGSLVNLRELPDPARHIFIHGNITDQELVEHLLLEYNIQAVVHFAAESHVDRSIFSPADFIHTNIVGTFTLLEAIRSVTVGKKPILKNRIRFHHISTDEVYGELTQADVPFCETTRYVPNSPYAASKAASDHLVRAYHRTYDLPMVITNCSNNYGPFQFPEKLIPLMIVNALSGKTLPIYGDGQQIRDWLYVVDHCDAIWLVLNHGRIGQTYNIGGDTQVTNLTVVHTICEILDELCPRATHSPYTDLIHFVKDRPGHDQRYAIDFSKLRDELDWQPKETLRTGLVKTIKWYLNNPDWITAVANSSEFQNWVETNYQKRGDILT